MRIISLAVVMVAAGCSVGTATHSKSEQIAWGSPDSLEHVAGPPNFPDSGRVVVRDQSHWSELWQRGQGPGPPASAPAIDFTSSMVLVATRGGHASTGYGVRIDTVYQSGDSLVAWVRSERPCEIVLPMMTYSWDAVRIPRAALPVAFVEHPLEPCERL